MSSPDPTDEAPPPATEAQPPVALEEFYSILEGEQRALAELRTRLLRAAPTVEAALSRLDRAPAGRIWLSGIGKAGLVARRLAATFASTGSPAHFIHPVDALHGDLGAARGTDALLVLSHSGETPELLRLVEEAHRLGLPTVAVCASEHSSLGTAADCCIEIGRIEEACYLGLAPTASAAVLGAVGDGLALGLARGRGFSPEDFARSHPSGWLGLRFRTAGELMRTDARCVRLSPEAAISRSVIAVSEAGAGAAILTDDAGRLVGVFTDGDLRRALAEGPGALERPVREHATCPGRHVALDTPVTDALELMQRSDINELPVVDPQTGEVRGVLCRKDLKV